MTPIEAVIGLVLDQEGGIADVGDGKGITRFGQTDDWLETWHLPAPETRAEAAANYLAWLGITGLGAVCTVNDALADATVNFAVMSGHIPAIRALQGVLGVAIDGVIGPVTTASLRIVNREKAADLVRAAWVRRLGAVITANPQKAKDAKGWGNRIADHLERWA